MRGKRRDWRVLVLVAMALAGIGVWRWLQRRAPADQAPEALPAPAEPVAIPVGEPMRAPVAVGATASSAASATAPMAASGAVAPPPPAVAPPPPAVAAPAPGRITRTDDLAHPFGPRSAAPSDDGGGPKGWVVKGNADSGLYHTPSSPSWKRMRAEAWFEDEAAAEAAGFTRWDWRRTAS